MHTNRSLFVQPAARHPIPVYPRPQPLYGYPPYGSSSRYPNNLQRLSDSFDSYPGAYGVSSFDSYPSASRVWMPAPLPLPSCPPGLEYLSHIDRLLIHQQVEIVEIITNIETYNKYEIKNVFGETLYFAFEENDCCTLTCCGASRPFIIKIVDNAGQEIIEFFRPYRCSSCFCPCCLEELFVYAPPGFPIGYVKQIWDPCLPRFAIQNTNERDMLRIVGPCSVCSCGGDVNFEVMSTDELHTVGRVSKYWTGFVREVFTDADDIGIQFPLDLDVKMKAVMLGACFLIDFMFFENMGCPGCCQCGIW